MPREPADKDLDRLTAELLGGSPEEFTAQRNAKVKELRASGQSELARALLALRKPALPLWAVNQVQARRREVLEQIEEAAASLKKAQAGAAAGRAQAGDALRAATDAFQRKLEAAEKVAEGTLRESGHPVQEETSRRITAILRESVLQGGPSWERLQRGVLAEEPEAGSDLLQMFTAGMQPTGRSAARAEARREAEQAERKARADEERAQRAADQAKRLRQEADEMKAAAERAAERAKAAEEEAARLQAEAAKSRRAARAR